jgi:hypothetical protein
MASASRSASLGTFSFNPYSAGSKKYGMKSSPNIGPVDKAGYFARDRRLAARKAAVSKVMNAKVGK